MPPGGRRAGSGRKKTKLALPEGIAGKILQRIGELKLKGIKNTEDYALQLLGSKDERIRKEFFIELMHQEYGRPVTKTETTHDFDPNAPLRIVIEHIGRPSNQTATEAK